MFKTKDNFIWINNCGSFAEKLINLDNYGSFADESFLAAGSDIFGINSLLFNFSMTFWKELPVLITFCRIEFSDDGFLYSSCKL